MADNGMSTVWKLVWTGFWLSGTIFFFFLGMRWIPVVPRIFESLYFVVPGWIVFSGVIVTYHLLVLDRSPGMDLDFERSRKTEGQLTENQAFELVRHFLFFRENIRIGEPIDRGIDNVEDPRGGEESSVRLFKLVFERKNRDEEVGLYMDLEQELDFDLNSFESMEAAANRVENMRFVRSSKVEDFNAALNDVRAQLGKSLMQTYTVTESEGGDVTYEVPGLPEKLVQNTESGGNNGD